MAEEQGSTFSEGSKGWEEVEVTGVSNRLSCGLEVERRFDTITNDSLGPNIVRTRLRWTALGDNTEGIGLV